MSTNETHTGIFWSPLRAVRKMLETKFVLTADEFAEHTATVHKIGVLQEKRRCLELMAELLHGMPEGEYIDGQIYFDANKVMNTLENMYAKMAGEE